MTFFPNYGYASPDTLLLQAALRDRELLAGADTNPDIPPDQLAAAKAHWTGQIAALEERGGFTV